MYLLDDIYCSHQRTRYGSRGDPVTIIADHDNVLIVEDNKGKRFPVPRSSVTENLISETKEPESVIKEPDPVIPSPKKAAPPPPTKRKRSGPPEQTNLF